MSHLICSIESCKTRVPGGFLYCQRHGGADYIPPRLRRDTACPESVRYAIEDMVVHMGHCPICAKLPFNTAVWRWDNSTRAVAHAVACNHGRHIILRIEDALRDHPYGLPAEPLRASASESGLIAILILHLKSCAACRAIRPLDRPVWEWDEKDKLLYEESACPKGIDLMKRWDHFRQARIAA